MNFKKIIPLCMAFLLAFSVSAGAKSLEFKLSQNTMYMIENGVISSEELETAPFTQNDRTMVPVRIISEKFGAEVLWDEATEKITIIKDDINIILHLNFDTAIVNGEEKTLDAPAVEYNGRTMVPLRFISENLNADVKYIDSTEHILISDEEPVEEINGKKITLEDYRSLLAYLGCSDKDDETKKEALIMAKDLFENIYSVSTLSSIVEKVMPEGGREYVNSEFDYFRDDVYKTALCAPLCEAIETTVLDSADIGMNFSEDVIVGKVYEKYENEFVTCKHILILADGERTKNEAKKEAERILKEIKSGKLDFDEAMMEYCEDTGINSNPEGYTFTKGNMAAEFEEAAFGLKIGEISGIVETSYGYHILKREPLPELSNNIGVYLQDMVLDELAEEAYKEAVSKSDIKEYKTIDEIASLLK